MIGVGVFFFFAGVNHNSDDVKGLSGILNELAGSGWGQLVLVACSWHAGLWTVRVHGSPVPPSHLTNGLRQPRT